ncbi:hypothetical protein B0T16DRAFT_191558 [Cercophora newfieldiana]|uniref:Complex 1 LYR protein domain-containing protein n=1 Tax=Cercophora newfieldiana TaxID=92897 RepID=A0AA39Y0Y5_9PEZI|nr:hypothetical protein B0T16DRAFT_191558 [Cercophora newfieldiana]
MPLPVKPARDARHRLACFALYRALLRQGRRVPLADDIAPGLFPGPAHPIQALVRKAFRRNRRIDSQRLVVSALQNGYRFLSLLHTAAQTPPPPARNEVLSFLRENQARVLAARARAAAVPPKPAPPPKPPILTLVSENPPVYKPTNPPRPLSDFKSGVRRVPTLTETMNFPFLRLNKPQSPILSRALRHRRDTRENVLIEVKRLRDHGYEEAKQEDQWEALVQKMLGAPEEKPTYLQCFKGALWEAQKWLNADYMDSLARGRALWEIVEREKALAKKEKDAAKRKAREERKARGEPLSLEAFERNLREKMGMWPPVGSIRREKLAERKEPKE